MPDTFRRILGVRFYVSDLGGLLDLMPGAGLVVVPSSNVMARLAEDEAHREAMEGADFAVTDSSFMVVLWLARTGERIIRISGLRLLRAIVASGSYRARGDTFWIMPTEADSEANLAYLTRQGFDVAKEDTYLAPVYARSGPLSDPALQAVLSGRRPKLIVVALAGGVQERLGWSLRRSLGYTPAILCAGGAIAFMSGRQTEIPVWADRLGFGWILRLLSSPGSFAKKVSNVWRLPSLISRFGAAGVR